jgi:hypothetical protein
MYITIAKRNSNELQINTKNKRKYKLIISTKNKRKYIFKVDIVSKFGNRTVSYKPLLSFKEIDAIRIFYDDIFKDTNTIPYHFIDFKCHNTKLKIIKNYCPII